MAFVGEISAYLKADNSDFKAKFEDASKVVERTATRFGTLGNMVGGAVGPLVQFAGKFGIIGAAVTAVVVGVQTMIDRVREAEVGVDKNTDAAKRFLGATEEIVAGSKRWRDTVADAAVKAVGAVNLMGEWVGKQIAIVKHGREQVETAEAIERQAIETLAAIEKQKAAAQEIAKIRQQTAAVEAKATEEAIKQLDLRTQITLQESKLQAAKDALAATDGDRVAAAKAELLIAQERATLDKLYAEERKKTAEVEKKAADEKAKDAAKLAELQAGWAEEEMEQLQDRFRLEREAAEEKQRAALAIVPVLDEELQKLQAQGTTREQIIATLRGQGFAEDEVLAKLRQQTQEIQFQIAIKSKGRGDTDLSDAVLEDKIRTLQKSISDAKNADFGSPYRNPFIAPQEKELAFARDELADRQRIRQQVNIYGEAGAARFYAGDMAGFERLLQHVGTRDDAQKQTQLLTELNDRLASSPLFDKFRRN